MADENVLEQLKTALTDLKQFLTDHQAELTQLVKTAAQLFPPIIQAIDTLIGLLNKLKDEITNLDLGQVQAGLDQVQGFVSITGTLLEAVKKFRPDLADEVAPAEDALNAVGQLPSLGQLKTDLINAINDVVNVLNQLKS